MSKALTLTFRALADPTRRQILARLAEGEATVQELADPLPISQPAVSKHLKVLEQAGIVARRQETPRRYARLRGEPIQSAITYLTEFQRRWDENFARLDALLDEEAPKKRRRR
ncbi:MAG TPA: metalloregulator ArsR/SmtB family transcription factor [Candidatus Thermoplasmatota archaeon]|nr:metalloregulator ArsR/SmtB family transcription factor [Candidatus Thermoplasmatota archaeon]